MAIALSTGRSVLALALFALAVASDIADGRFARSTGSVSARGGLLDHSADAFFVALGLAVGAKSGAIALPLPLLIAVSFAFYVRDSGAHRGASLRGSRLGRTNGIAYYGLLGALIAAEVLVLDARMFFLGTSWLLVATTLLSIITRKITRG